MPLYICILTYIYQYEYICIYRYAHIHTRLTMARFASVVIAKQRICSKSTKSENMRLSGSQMA